MSNTVKVLRGSAIIANGNTTLTLTNGTDYTLEDTDDTKWFFRITNSNFTGMGSTTGGGQYTDDHTVVPTQSGANTVLTRAGSAGNCRVDWEIVQYTGTTSNNEFIVREKGLLTLANGVATSTPSLPSGISNNNDVVIWITGQAGSNTGQNVPQSALFTAEMGSTTWTATRGNTRDNGYLAYAIVEYTGSDYTVHSESFTVSSAVTTHTLSTAVSDTAETFIHAQNRYDLAGTAGIDDASVRVHLSSTTALSVRNETSTDLSLKEHVVYLVENPNLTVQRVTAEMSGTGEEEIETVSITQVADTELTSLTGLTSTSTGGGNFLPRGYINFTLSSDSSVLLKQSDNGQTSQYSFEVVEWPSASSAYSLTLDAGAYAYTGSPVALAANRAISIISGGYAYTGSAVNLAANRALTIDSGSYLYNGSAVNLAANRVLTIDSGSYTYNGSSISLSVGRALTIDAGSYSYTGNDVLLAASKKLAIDSASYNYTGNDVSLSTGRAIALTPGSYSIIGQDVLLRVPKAITIDAAVYDYSGYPVSLSYSGEIISLISGYSVEYKQDDITGGYKLDDVNADYEQDYINVRFL